MILCCWSSNARLSQRILKLQMPTAKVGYRAPKGRQNIGPNRRSFFLHLFLYMSWTGLAKLRKRRAAFIPALDPYVGGLGVVLRTAFLFEVQTTPRYPQCITVLFFEGCHRSWTRNFPNHIERLMKLPSVESVPVKSPRFRWWDQTMWYEAV